MSGYDLGALQVETDQQRAKGQESYLSQEERALVGRLLGAQEDIPKSFIDWMVDAVAVNIPLIPISQVQGFRSYKQAVEDAQAAIEANQVVVTQGTVLDFGSTSSDTFTDLATAGPTLSDLADGSYILMFGAGMSNNTNGGFAQMSVSVNAASASADDCVHMGGLAGVGGSSMRAVAKTLSAGSNEVVCKYRRPTATGTAQFERRWILAMKIGP